MMVTNTLIPATGFLCFIGWGIDPPGCLQNGIRRQLASEWKKNQTFMKWQRAAVL